MSFFSFLKHFLFYRWKYLKLHRFFSLAVIRRRERKKSLKEVKVGGFRGSGSGFVQNTDFWMRHILCWSDELLRGCLCKKYDPSNYCSLKTECIMNTAMILGFKNLFSGLDFNSDVMYVSYTYRNLCNTSFLVDLRFAFQLV